MAQLSLLRQGNELADPTQQRAALAKLDQFNSFDEMLGRSGHSSLRATEISTLQINVGKVCNQTCSHCHVDAGPDRRESMSLETAKACIDALERGKISTLDITGGAPEMNPHFRMLTEEASRLGKQVIDRCNLTILTASGFQYLPEFLAEHRVQVVASLPCYLEENTDAQRGNGVFKRSIEGLRLLNQLGYGKPDSGLELALVYNPVGKSLPPEQAGLEAAYRKQLKERYDVDFNRLYTITNLPISRFLDDLLSNGQLEDYMEKLVNAFNPGTVDGLMCRNLISVDWQGFIYDCDFNQMLDLPILHQLEPTTHSDPSSNHRIHISDVDFERMARREIRTARHCFGCTAGAGSSCGGAIIE